MILEIYYTAHVPKVWRCYDALKDLLRHIGNGAKFPGLRVTRNAFPDRLFLTTESTWENVILSRSTTTEYRRFYSFSRRTYQFYSLL